MPKFSVDAATLQYAVVVAAVALALALVATRDPHELLQPLPFYDYIVVGSGSAGAVVAARLSENPAVSVLLLEAGPPDTFWGSKFLMQIPAFTPFFQRSAADWAFRSQPQHNAARALNDRVSAWPRGRVLGGSSVLNYMQYVRGHADDFDSWRLPGWRFSDLLPFFVKAEAQHRQEFAEADGIHGSSGPLHVSDHMQVHELTQAWVKSLANDGFRTRADYNSPDQGGNRTASASQVTPLVIVPLSPHIRYPCSGDTAQRPAHLHGPRLPAPQRAPRQPARRHLLPRHARAVRRQQRCPP
jgi:choline dehydrogenase-like flavoprotein